MGSGGSKSPPVKETLTSNKEKTESSSPSPAPLDTNVNVNSGGKSTNQNTAESRPPNQSLEKLEQSGELKPSEKSVLPEKASDSEDNKEQIKSTEATMPTSKLKEGGSPGESEERLIPEVHKDQQLFDDAISSACQLVKSQSLLKLVTQNVTSLCLQRALPQGFSLYELLKKMTNLQDLDLSHNDMGPQSFRSLCLAMCTNTSILCLNLSDNKTDTDSAECLGLMLSHNGSLSYLNISNNYFGKDYFSRCVGPALKTNTSLMNFRAENIGSTDVKDFLAGLQENTSLTELDFSNNWVTDKTALGAGLGEVLKRENCGLISLALAGCEINKTGAAHLLDGVKQNTSLNELNVNGLEFESLSHLLHFVAVAANNPNLQVLSIDGAKFKDTTVDTKDIALPSRDVPPSLQILSLSDSHLTDEFFDAFQTLYQGRQIPLTEIDISSNDGLTGKCVHFLAELTKGFKIKKTGDQIQPGSCDLPKLPEGLVVRLTELGGNTGDIGQMLDSVRIKTDYVIEKPPLLTYTDILTICAVLKGSGSEIPVWSSEHWRMITGLNRPTADAPSWLELPDNRDRCLYLSNLPASSTTQKLEAILEMDADCNLQEVCLMKDPVTRSVSGVGWALMADEESLQKAVDFYNSGEAKVFGQSFIISRVKVKVDDDEHSVAAQKAKEDLELRMKLRQKEEQDLRRLIQRTTEESWKRHAYRLAHPAYADGRIW